MKKLIKLLFLTLIFIISISSCLKNEIINDEIMTSKSLENNDKPISINIFNNAENVKLDINSIGLDKDNLVDVNVVLAYNDSITVSIENKSNDFSKIFIYGELCSEDYSIYNGNIIIPILNNDKSTINLHLYDNCNWYDENGNKVLQSIQFDATVNEWK